MKKLVLLTLIVLLSEFVLSQSLVIDVVNDNLQVEESLEFKVSVYEEGNLIDDEINVAVEDSEKKEKIERVVSSDELVKISLGDSPTPGYWKITAEYEGKRVSELFFVNENEKVRFELNNNILTVTNIGNTNYNKKVQIVIGDSLGYKEVELNVGESRDLRLIAPDGSYKVRITDGETTLIRSGVSLTGRSIGILDERMSDKSPLTSGQGGEKEGSFFDYSSSNPFVYVFLIVIFAAGILLVIERYFRKRYSSD